MPTKREREYYRMGYSDGYRAGGGAMQERPDPEARFSPDYGVPFTELLKRQTKPKRKLSAWNKYVKANSKKPRFRYRNGKLNLKKMAVAFRKTRKRGGKR